MSVTRPNLLFVDDDPLILKTLRRALSRQSGKWNMVFVQSVDEAMEALERMPFDLILSDARMPGRDGFDFLAETRRSEAFRRIPFIVFTGDEEPSLKRRALDMGATDLLNKPSTREDLVARIQSALRLKFYQDQQERQMQILDERVRARTAELEESQREIIWRLAKASEYRDDATGNHVVRVACYSRAVARRLDLASDFIDALFLASPLHDIGKIGIADNVLLKPGILNTQERRHMETHCEIGAEILARSPSELTLFQQWRPGTAAGDFVSARNPLLEMASSIALTHHERWDGTGYPRGLKGDEIPLESRIVAVADVYDALLSKRPYKPAFAPEQAWALMGHEKGRHFDPEVYDAFLAATEEVHAIHSDFLLKEQESGRFRARAVPE